MGAAVSAKLETATQKNTRCQRVGRNRGVCSSGAGEGDRAKAMSPLDESLAISSDLGMRPLVERVLSRREILRA